MRKTGIVMEINDNMALVLETGGEFKNVKAESSWRKGDTIVLEKAKPAIIYIKQLSVIAASLVVLAIAGLIGYNSYNNFFTEHTLISVDINPSFELAVNSSDKVISARGYNEDADMVLEDMNLNGTPYSEALRTILDSEEMKPYIDTREYLTFSVYSKGSEKEIIKELDLISKEIKDKQPNIKTECKKVSENDVEQAHSHSITAGKYTAIEELREYKPEVSVEEYATEGIGEIKEEIEVCKQERARERKRAQGGENSGNAETHNGNGKGNGNGVGAQPEDGTGNKYGQTDGGAHGDAHGGANGDGQGQGGQGTGNGNGNGQGAGNGGGNGQGQGKGKGKHGG